MYPDIKKKKSGSAICPDGSCRIDMDKLRDAQARFGDNIRRNLTASAGEMVIALFSKKDCPVCEETKAVIKACIDELEDQTNLTVRYFDLDTTDGLMEGSMRNALDIPTTILEWHGEEIVRWEQECPSREVLLSKITTLPA